MDLLVPGDLQHGQHHLVSSLVREELGEVHVRLLGGHRAHLLDDGGLLLGGPGLDAGRDD